MTDFVLSKLENFVVFTLKEKREAQGHCTLPKFTQLVSGRARLWTQTRLSALFPVVHSAPWIVLISSIQLVRQSVITQYVRNLLCLHQVRGKKRSLGQWSDCGMREGPRPGTIVPE